MLELLQDRAASPIVREAAGSILRSCGAENRFELPAMLQIGDPIVQRHAILGMDRGHAELVEPIARDPGHPFHHAAIRAMTWGFMEPRFQALKIAALSHPDPLVRESAADVLLWDEPVVAEEPLLAALDDPDERVVVAAANTLQYYPTRRTLTRLSELSAHEGKPGEQAKCSFEQLRDQFQSELQYAKDREREHLLAWMQPVWAVLAFTDEEMNPQDHEPFVPTHPIYVVIEANELIESLFDPDGLWAEKKRRMQKADPVAFSPSEIERLAPFLATHPDPAVRCDAARLLAAWDDYEALFALLDDPRFVVSKTAMYYLGKTTPSPLVAARARRHLSNPRATSTHGYETLATYLAHAPREEAIPYLVELADDEREVIRVDAIEALAKRGAAREIEPLLGLLEAPPLMTWAVHVALLEAAIKLELEPRALHELGGVDNLDLQRAIARCGSTPSLA